MIISEKYRFTSSTHEYFRANLKIHSSTSGVVLYYSNHIAFNSEVLVSKNMKMITYTNS